MLDVGTVRFGAGFVVCGFIDLGDVLVDRTCIFERGFSQNLFPVRLDGRGMGFQLGTLLVCQVFTLRQGDQLTAFDEGSHYVGHISGLARLVGTSCIIGGAKDKLGFQVNHAVAIGVRNGKVLFLGDVVVVFGTETQVMRSRAKVTEPFIPRMLFAGMVLAFAARLAVGLVIRFRFFVQIVVDRLVIWTYARRFYALPGFADTVDFDIYRRGCFSPSPKRNPFGIVPTPPDISWDIAKLLTRVRKVRK
ncbi:hypothetical protein [Falsiruegeria mediterranea]